MQEIASILRQEFNAVLEQAGDTRLRLIDTRVVYDMEFDQWRCRFDFITEPVLPPPSYELGAAPPQLTNASFTRVDRTLAIPCRMFMRATGMRREDEVRSIAQLADRIFSECVEDRHMQGGLARERERLHEVLRSNTDPATVQDAIARYDAFRDHVAQHHRPDNLTATEVRERQREYANRFATRLDMMYGARFLDYRGPYYAADFGFGDSDPEAEKRGEALLIEHLTPDQKSQYAKHTYFDVKGCDSGKTYRITKGRQMNIYELDNKGEKACGWCFLPSGNLCTGDTMLSQKIALEVEEKKALKVANRFAVGGAPDLRAGAINWVSAT